MVEQLFNSSLEEVPDYYVDAVRVAANLYTFVLELGRQGVPDTPGSEPPPTKRLALVRMSPQHALILMKILQKNLRKYQDEVGRIQVPEQMYRDLDLEPD
jgi:hypothetical protein